MVEDAEVPRAEADPWGLLRTTYPWWAPRASPGVTSIPRSRELSPQSHSPWTSAAPEAPWCGGPRFLYLC